MLPASIRVYLIEVIIGIHGKTGKVTLSLLFPEYIRSCTSMSRCSDYDLVKNDYDLVKNDYDLSKIEIFQKHITIMRRKE